VERKSLTLNYSGGEEVLLDVGGQDSTEAFEDVGHSDEAREILDGLLVGNLKRSVRLLMRSNKTSTIRWPRHKQEGDPKPKSYAQPTSSASTSDGAGLGVGLYAIVLLGGALAFGAYKYLQGQSQQEVSI
jgi:hypothetical protein